MSLTHLIKKRFHPKLITTLKAYSFPHFQSDVVAGITVGIVALPLALAFAIASGVRPEQGLFTAIIAGFVISVFGGSRVQISGPTGAFIVLIYGIVHEFGYAGLAVATMLAGLILIGIGLAGLGNIIKIIPRPLIVGFTAGIALIIFTSQLRDFLGLPIPKLPAESIEQWKLYAENISSASIPETCLALASLVFIISYPRFVTHARVPAPLITIVVTTILVYLFDVPVAIISDRFGAVPSVLPAPALPALDWEMLPSLIRPAVAIALLGAIESLLSAMVADGMTGFRHRANTELIAQGIGNIVSPLFQGIPATGAIARTATNVRAGAKTPISGVVHSLTLIMLMMVFAPFVGHIPLCVLAAILISVAWNMSERHAFISLLRFGHAERAVLLVTFVMTVVADLTTGIEMGVLVASAIFLRQSARSSGVNRPRPASVLTEAPRSHPDQYNLPPEISVFEVYGPLFFASAQEFKDTIDSISKEIKVIVLLLRRVPFVDSSGLYEIEQFLERCSREECRVLFAETTEDVMQSLDRSTVIKKLLSPKNLFPSLDSAVNAAYEIVKMDRPASPPSISGTL